MLGWEFPPLINGGLGIACYGIAKALSKVSDLTVILPKSSSETFLDNVKILGLNEIDVEGTISYQNHYSEEIKKYEEFAKVYSVQMKTGMTPYRDAKKSGVGFGNDAWSNQQHLLNNWMDDQSVHVKLGKFAMGDKMYGEDVQQKVVEFADYVAALASNLEFDVIHAHDWMTMLAGVKLKYQSGKPLVIHAHALSYDRAGPESRGWNYDLEKYGLEMADAIIPVSFYTGRIVESHYGINASKIHPVHNGIEPVETFKQEKTFPEKLVLFLGRITGQKGPEFFLEVASKVIAEDDNVRFVMAGSGDQLKRIIETGAYRKVGNKFHFTGFLSRDKVNQLLAMSDVYCMPSVSEPFGLSAVEAAQFGVPAVISKQSGAAECMTHALKADFWDVDLMAKHISNLLANDKLRNYVIEKTFEDIESVTWDNTVIGILNAYQKVMNEPLAIPEKQHIPVREESVPEIAEKPNKISIVGNQMIETIKDDLKKIEGIGPKIESLLNKEGIFTFQDLSNARRSRLVNILTEAGKRYKMHDPSTWSEQAELAANGDWDQLKVLQDELDGGKR